MTNIIILSNLKHNFFFISKIKLSREKLISPSKTKLTYVYKLIIVEIKLD